MIRRILVLLIVGLVIVVALLLVWPVTLDPVAWTPEPNTHGEPPFIKNQRLTSAILIETGEGPESVAVDASGAMYTGLLDGRIVRYGFDGRHQEIANTQGRPLGLEFDTSGRLVIADADKGLLRREVDGSLKVLVDAYEGVPLKFTDDLAIDASG
ncbi:MAG: SMP-30/gluconolactonase/LRE family protein, partial [Myxococcota bacterium]